MNRGILIPSSVEVELVCLRQQAGAVLVELRAHQSSSSCPSCGRRSFRVHSRYRRTIADLPWEGVPVKIWLGARKFFCDEDRCSRRIFTEQLPETVARFSRRSCRSREALSSIALALGGRAGARLARKLGLLASGSTLLRELRKRARPPASPAPRVIGIDEWAWKKRHRYGTILCDLERGRVIDLLPNRSTETVAAWLSQHPSVEVVSRDRASSFADAIARGAPKAVQVADRWHLLNNLLETLVRSLEPHRHTMSEVARQMVCKSSSPPPPPEVEAAPTAALRRTMEKREHRLMIYQELTRLLAAGHTQSEASRQLGVGLRTVQRWLACGVFPERKHRVFPSIVDSYGPHLEKRYAEGCRNITLLWQELTERGFEGQSCTVRSWLRQRFGSPKKGKATLTAKRPIPTGHQRIAWLMLKAQLGRNRYLKALYEASPTIAQIAHTARDLFDIIRRRDAAAWPGWLEAAANSPYARFARHLRRDKHAIAAALQLPWSNGIVEGQIHRLKLLKRQMYGRASFDLLRLRVLHST
jgi:transposase